MISIGAYLILHLFEMPLIT